MAKAVLSQTFSPFSDVGDIRWCAIEYINTIPTFSPCNGNECLGCNFVHCSHNKAIVTQTCGIGKCMQVLFFFFFLECQTFHCCSPSIMNWLILLYKTRFKQNHSDLADSLNVVYNQQIHTYTYIDTQKRTLSCPKRLHAQLSTLPLDTLMPEKLTIDPPVCVIISAVLYSSPCRCYNFVRFA